MTELLPDEMEVLNLGRELTIPPSLAEGEFCFHKCIWFLTGSFPDFPELPTYNAHIRRYLGELKSKGELQWGDPPFEAVRAQDLRPLEILSCLSTGVYLVHLLDKALSLGHWIVLTDRGVFDPGANRCEIPSDKWVSLFRNRYAVRRLFPILGRRHDTK